MKSIVLKRVNSEHVVLKRESSADQSFNIAEIITQNVGYNDILLAVDL